MSEVRLRFPPSPTGYLHIGGARTAIYNWLYARKHGGKLVLRIEDTDTERSTPESTDAILDSLRWLGIDWDEGPYLQSDHLREHIDTAKKLIESGHAYKCFCSKDELDKKRETAIAARRTYQYDRTCCRLTPGEIAEQEKHGIPYAVRFKVPDRPGSLVFTDKVYGRIEKAYSDLEDFVIVRSNGKPLYLLSNVVDDIRDRITHIIRGADGLANTPRQILIYEALNAPVPVFAHMSLTLDPRKAKISKRSHGEVVTVGFYREKGFLPWALLNFLVLLGWSSGDDREIFSRQELIEAFSLEGLSKANAIFNYHKNDPKFFTDPKALNLNGHYLHTLPVEEIAPLVAEDFKRQGLWKDEYDGEKKEWFLSTIDLIRDRFFTIKDFAEQGRAYFDDTYPMDPKAVKKNITKHDNIAGLLARLADRLEALDDFSLAEIEKATRALAEELDVKAGILINGSRTVVTGQIKGAGIFDVLVAIGRERVVDRLRRTAELTGTVE